MKTKQALAWCGAVGGWRVIKVQYQTGADALLKLSEQELVDYVGREFGVAPAHVRVQVQAYRTNDQRHMAIVYAGREAVGVVKRMSYGWEVV